MKVIALALMVATSTSGRPTTVYERRLARELSLQVRRAEQAELDRVTDLRQAALVLQSALDETERERQARRACEESVRLPDWFWPIMGVAAAGAGLGVYAIVRETER